MLASVTALRVADDPDAWRAAGFTVHGDECALGPVRIRLGGTGQGIVGWTVFHPDEAPGRRSVDGLDTELIDELATLDEPAPHPNTADTLDHVVVSTPDIERTTAAFGELGVEARRTRDTTAGNAPLRQRFFRMGTIVELIGPPEPDPAGGPARLWGLAVVAPDLSDVVDALGPNLGRIKDAVQPGRQIATLRTRELGISVPLAFMTPHPR